MRREGRDLIDATLLVVLFVPVFFVVVRRLLGDRGEGQPKSCVGLG